MPGSGMIAESNRKYFALVRGFLTDREESNRHPETEEELCIGYGLCVTERGRMVYRLDSGWLTWTFFTPGNSSKAHTTRGSQPAQVIP